MKGQAEDLILTSEEVPASLYFVTNRFNLLEILSSRYIAPRAAYVKYYPDLLELTPGRVPLVTAPIGPSLQSVCSRDPNTFPVGIEISASKLSALKAPAVNRAGQVLNGTSSQDIIAWAPDFVIPLSWCRRVVFRSDAELREHVARKYDNVPDDALPFAVAANVFGSSESSELIGWLRALPASSVSDAEDFRIADRLSGARCVALATVPYAPRAANVAAMLLRTSNGTKGAKSKTKGKRNAAGDSPAPWITIPKNQESPDSKATLDERLFSEAARVLMTLDKTAGWKPLELIDRIEKGVRTGSLTKRDGDQVTKSFEAIRAIVSNERDFRPFKAGSGSDVAKALLLFFMRRDPQKLIAWPLRETGAVDSVMITAAVFAGLFVGRSRLPLTLRPGAVDEALANMAAMELSDHVVAMRSRLVANQVEIADDIGDSATSSKVLLLDRTELARWSPALPSLSETLLSFDYSGSKTMAMAIEICRLLGWSTAIQATVTIETGKYSASPATQGKGMILTTTGWPLIESTLIENEFRERLTRDGIPQEYASEIDRLMKDSPSLKSTAGL
jgi:hypothetical protein